MLEAYPGELDHQLPPAGAGREEVVNRLVERFPNVSVIDLTAIMGQVKRISDQVSRAVEFVFLFAIAAGLVVLFAAITSTQDERVFEGAVMRTLGASRRQMVLTQLSEFLAIGLLSGLVAAAGAVGLAMVLSERVLGVPVRVQLGRARWRASSRAGWGSPSPGSWARARRSTRRRWRPSAPSPEWGQVAPRLALPPAHAHRALLVAQLGGRQGGGRHDLAAHAHLHPLGRSPWRR